MAVLEREKEKGSEEWMRAPGGEEGGGFLSWDESGDE